MAKNDGRKVSPFSNFIGGISDFDKFGAPNTYAFGRSIDYRSNPRELTLLSKTTKETGSVVTDLLKWGDRVSNTSYFYGSTGNIYQRTSTPTWSLLRTVASSHGNGMTYFGEDDYLYYTSDKLIGRYGPIINGTPSFSDDYFGSQGGVPLNTQSMTLVAASSQYDDRADTASLSITSNFAAEVYVKFTTLPAVGSSMTFVAKWDESANTRSYRVDVAAISGYFGDGTDSSVTISSNTTDVPIDSAATGTVSVNTLSATNASFAQGQIVLIHQSQGSGYGTWQRNTITGYTAGTITLETPLNATYISGAQVLVMKRYTTVTVNNGFTWTCKAWNGTTGGILAFLASTSVSCAGTISAKGGNGTYASPGQPGTGGGFRGGTARQGGNNQIAGAGEGVTGGNGTQTITANGTTGGGAASSGPPNGYASGAGGTHATVGQAGQTTTPGKGGNGIVGSAGSTLVGSADLTTMVIGSGGGAASTDNTGATGGGGNGGGIIFITTVDITVTGTGLLTAAGGNGGQGDYGCGGGGSGGSILIKCQTATLNTSLVVASGGLGGTDHNTGTIYGGGYGGDGRIHIDYLTSYTGTTLPTINATQDSSLVTTTTYQLRLGISNDGTAFENLTKNLTTLSTGVWVRFGVSWVAATSIATFYQDGLNIGTFTGTKTSISDNASRFYVGAHKGAAAVGNFFNGKIDDLRVWNTVRSDSQMIVNKDVQLGGTETGLAAYYKFNNAHTDSTANANTLTANNTPTFTTDVPFSSPTTRLDIDQSSATSSQTYTTPLLISETSTDMKTFVPAKDPQKSMDVLVAAKGTGNWTVTIHDGLNREIATATITNANVTVGYTEFTWSTVWRPIIGATYHFHITSTVADGTVTTGTVSDLSTVSYHTYYQFLVNDGDYHPIQRFLNMIAIGNERYVATYDASTYTPHKLKLPAGWKVRCFGQWREYLAIGCWKGTNMYDYDDGIIFFWDGYSTTYNFYVTVPEGGINAMLSSRGVLYVWAGYQGDILTYIGGDKADKLKRIPKMTKDKYLEIMPGAVTMWQANLRFGVGGNSDSTLVERGAYTLGQTTSQYPLSLSYDYPLSTGNRTNSNIKVGLLFPLDRKMLIGWQDNTSFGADVVDPTAAPFATGTIERLIDDSGEMHQDKLAQTIKADFKTLATGESVTLKYKLDRASAWTSGAAVTSGDTARLNIPWQSHKEIQIAADLATSVSTAPTVLSLALDKDLDSESEDF